MACCGIVSGGKIPYFDKVILFFQLCTAYGCGAMLQWSGNHIDNRNKNNEGRFNDDVNLVFTGGLGWLVGQFIICLFGMGLGKNSPFLSLSVLCTFFSASAYLRAMVCGCSSFLLVCVCVLLNFFSFRRQVERTHSCQHCRQVSQKEEKREEKMLLFFKKIFFNNKSVVSFQKS